MSDEALVDPIVLRFIPYVWTKPKPTGGLRVSSGAFYSVSNKGRGFSVFFKDGTDVERNLERLPGYGVAEIRLGALLALGFTVERSEAEGDLEGDHADVRPPPDWSDSKYSKMAKRVCDIAPLVIEPRQPRRIG